MMLICLSRAVTSHGCFFLFRSTLTLLYGFSIFFLRASDFSRGKTFFCYELSCTDSDNSPFSLEEGFEEMKGKKMKMLFKFFSRIA